MKEYNLNILENIIIIISMNYKKFFYYSKP